MTEASMYAVSGVFSVAALGLGLGGFSWAPLVFMGTCLLSLFASLWQYGYFEDKKQYELGDRSALAGWGFIMGPMVMIACIVACLLALLVSTLALGESDTVLSLVSFVVAFAGGLILTQKIYKKGSMDSSSS